MSISPAYSNNEILSREAIAIIGIGCRFPGASGANAFWKVLRDGIETTGEYPGGRFPFIDGVYSAGSAIATRRGGFLPALDQFDAEFFELSPREAALLDPQQRLLLEVGWEAVEDAGIPAGKIAGSQTGVFVGLWNSDYEHCLYSQAGDLDFHATTGGGRYSASGRLAYFLDLRGPNLTLDTACSSSLVAIHLACQSLRQGESEMAIAGGANVILRPEITLTYSAAKMLSPDGRSKFGDSGADGYVRSEGAALILLKPLSRALADRDPIYALIRGSAVNNDGRSSGLLVSPSREGQEALLRSAFRNAGVDPGAIDYIEAHGTGTLVGDPVEIETIGRVVNAPGRLHPCSLGSVKTNIGHTESAAGVAGVIKVALSLQHGAIPASLHLRQPNPAIDWNELPVSVQRATAPWPDSGQRRLAGVSGFGITGTNAHVVLENFGTAPLAPPTRIDDHLFVLSARSERALQGVASAWCERLQDGSSGDDPEWPSSLPDLAFTAAVRRTHHDFRLAVTTATRAELKERLAAWLKGEQIQGVQAGPRLGLEHAKAVFVFPGQGGQWPGMARGLIGQAVFRDALAECDEAVRKHTGWSVIDRLMGPGFERIEDIDVVQPCLFAVMVAVAALWRSWGIEPQAVIGHSMGECAAAAVSGALSVQDAAAVVCQRSRLMKSASGKGLMAIAELSMDEAAEIVDKYDGRISVAAQNSPTSIVLSGDADAIEDALLRIHEREVFCRRINVEVASHSAHMDPLRNSLAELLRDIRPRAGSIPLYSTTSGHIEDGSGLDAEYWARNLRQPVLFSSALQNLLRDGFDTFVEVNAHPVLLQAVEDGIRHSGKRAVAVPSLRRDHPDYAEMLNGLGALHVAGFPVDFRKLYPEGECLRLPAYPWQRERHWIEVADAPAQRRSSAPSLAASDCTNDLYDLNWIEYQPPPSEPKPAGVWILVGGEDAADGVARYLEAAGDECIRVSDAEDLGRALEVSGDLCRGVVRWGTTRESDAHAAAAEAFDIVRTVRTITTADIASTPRLWLLSSGAWHFDGDTHNVCAAQGTAWGLGRVIVQEHADLRCVNLDHSPFADSAEMETVASLLREDGPEEQVAVRGAKRLTARYERITEGQEGAAPQFRADATYLITGGMGGIGMHIARWMAHSGARHLALVGRRAPSDPAREQIAAIESLGVTVRVFSADITDDDQVAAMLHEIRSGMPALRGIFHLAATTDAMLLREISAERLQRVMRPKAVGAWTLHRHVNDDLDFFVLFSSITAAISQPGLGSYVSANAYVDGLARFRRAKGLKAQSILWGPWDATGLANDEQVQRGRRHYTESGIRALAAEGALRGLGRIMTLGKTDILVLPVSWEQFGRRLENAEPPRAFLNLVPKKEADRPAAPVESIRATLMQLEAGRRTAALEAHLQEKLAAVLKIAVTRIDLAKPFGAMGLDSLMGLEFVRRLSATTSLRLPATVVFNYPTVRTLAAEIGKRMGLATNGAAPAAPTQASRPSSVSAAAALTDEEAIEALMGRSGRAE